MNRLSRKYMKYQRGGQSIIYANDSFVDTAGTNLSAHTANPGGSWTIGLGTWTITPSGNCYVTATSGDGENAAWLTVPSANVRGSVTCLAGFGGEIRVVANATNVNQLWLLYIAGTSMIIFEKTAAGTYTNRANTTISALTAGNPYTVAFTTNGDTITFTYSGTTIQYTGSPRANKSATTFGIGGLTAAPAIKFNNITLTSF